MTFNVCTCEDDVTTVKKFLCSVIRSKAFCLSSLFYLDFEDQFLDLWADVKLIAAEVDNQIVCGQFVCFLF